MYHIIWGDPIEAGSVGYPVRGEKPAWLASDEPIAAMGDHHTWYKSARIGIGPEFDIAWLQIVAFKLPADHWAYEPIAAGFTPWAGGESCKAPDDWDGGEVMVSGGSRSNNYVDTSLGWKKNNRGPIGYHRRTASAEYQAVQTLAQRIAEHFNHPLQPHEPTVFGAVNALGRLFEAVKWLPTAPLAAPPVPLQAAVWDGSAIDIINKVVSKINGKDRPPYPHFHSVNDGMNAIDGLLTQMDRREPSDWYTPHPDNMMVYAALHVPTIRACKAYVTDTLQSLDDLLPPDPLIERAKQLHNAAREAWAVGAPPPGVPVVNEWEHLSEALRKFWIAMARIDRERSE